MEAIYFKSGAEFRRWLEKNHAQVSEQWLGFHKTHANERGITRQEAVDEALCFGWIDGLVKGIDDSRFMVRFTPRKPRSIWSAVNTRRVEELKQAGRMTASGIKAFTARDPKRSGIYSFENPVRALDAAFEKQFKAKADAWNFFHAQAPSYRRAALWWVTSAKKEETRRSRLHRLIEDSLGQRRLKHLVSPTRKKNAPSLPSTTES